MGEWAVIDAWAGPAASGGESHLFGYMGEASSQWDLGVHSEPSHALAPPHQARVRRGRLSAVVRPAESGAV